MTALALPLGSEVAGPPPARSRRRRTAAQVAVVLAVSVLPLLQPAGPGNTGLADVGVLVVLAVAALWLSGGTHVVRLPYAVPVAISVVAGALAGLVAGGGVLVLVQDLFLLGWAVAIANLGRSPELVRTLVRTWALSVTVWAALMDVGVLAHIALLSGQTARDGSRASLTFGDPNLAANYFLCGLLVLRACRTPRSPGRRFLCCLVIVTAIVLTGSNGGMVALLLATAAGVLVRHARRGRPALAVVLACVLVVTGGVAAAGLDLSSMAARARQSAPLLRDSIGREAESGGSRSTLVREGLGLWGHGSSLLGVGPGGTKDALLAEQAPYVKEAHDDYLAALVERGLLGGVALVLLIVLVAVRARRIGRPDALSPQFAEIVPRPELLGVAVGALLLSAFFYEVLHFRHVWALFGLIAAIELWGRRGEAR
ncbi:MAG TPA: O-antigen ligase family protein [Mycobacteriales bacterium]|nr:O-antigen ligase family protein [Mycobacteriales bacterium]